MTTKTKTMNNRSREQIQQALDAGCHVGISGGITLRPGSRNRVEGGNLAAIFGEAKEVEAAIIRDPNGYLTRAGMEHAILNGGSVMLGGEIYDTLDSLPDDDTLDAIRARETHAAGAALDTEIARLSAARAHLKRGAEFRALDEGDAPGGLQTRNAPAPGVVAPAAATAPDASNITSPPVTPAAPPDLSKMKKDELLAAAEQRKIEGAGKMTNDELRAAIEAADKKAAGNK